MKKIFAISIIFLFANLAMASLIGNYGSERSGVSGMTFLKIAPGARAEGMGGLLWEWVVTPLPSFPIRQDSVVRGTVNYCFPIWIGRLISTTIWWGSLLH